MEASDRGPRGRPLTRVLAYLAMILTASLAVGAVAALILDLGESADSPALTPIDLLLTGLLLAPVQLLITHLFLRRVDRCGWRVILAAWTGPGGNAAPPPARGSLGGGSGGRQFALGWGLAAGMLGLVLAGCAAATRLHVAGWGPVAAAGWLPAAATAAASLLAALLQGGLEEVIFRGYVMHNLALWRGLPAAIGISSLAFGVVHVVNPGAQPIALANVTLIGVFLGLLRARSTLWTAIGLHSGWNGLLVLLSLPCSGYRFAGLLAMEVSGPALWTGGGFGLEASLFVTIIFAAGVAVLGLSRAGGPAHPAGARAPCDSEPAPPRST